MSQGICGNIGSTVYPGVAHAFTKGSAERKNEQEERKGGGMLPLPSSGGTLETIEF